MKNTLTFNQLNIVDCVDCLNDGSNELWLHFQKTTSVVVTGHGTIIADPDTKINSSWYLTSDLILNIDGRIITIKHPTTTTGQMMVRRVSDNVYQLSFGGESGIVDITPVLTEGVEIARYTIDGETGSIYAPEGVSKEYVDNADLNVKKISAQQSNAKYDESVLPSQLTNKLYVYGNPQAMYPASEIGGDMPPVESGTLTCYKNMWLGTYQVKNDIKIYGFDELSQKTYDRLCVIGALAGQGYRFYSMICASHDVVASALNTSITSSISDSFREDGGIKKSLGYIRSYDMFHPENPPSAWTTFGGGGSNFSGNPIYDNVTSNACYGFNCDVPLFLINENTDAAFTKLNTFISTGDASGADNYADINPYAPSRYCAIDVITGDWYKVVNGAWVKQGTLELNSSGGGASNLSDLSDVELTNLSNGQILQYNSTSEKWENADNQGSLPFEFVIDSTDNGINIVYDDSILNGGE